MDAYRRKAYQRSMLRILNKALNEEGIIAYDLLNEEDKFLYQHIVTANELQDLKRWVGFMIKKKFNSKNDKNSSMLTGWLSWGFRQTELSLEEQQRLFEEEWRMNDKELENIRTSMVETPQATGSEQNLSQEDLA